METKKQIISFYLSELKRETNVLKLCTEDIENDSCMNEESYKGVAFHIKESFKLLQKIQENLK